MAHSETYEQFQTINSADINRALLLIRQGITLTPTGIRIGLGGSIKLEDLSPELQAILNPVSTEEIFVGDGIATVFTLASTPIEGTLRVHLNGILSEPIVEHGVTGDQLTFVNLPGLGDKINVFYKSSDVLISSPSILGNFTLSHKNMLETISDFQNVYTYGANKSGGAIEVVKFNSGTLVQSGSAINVSSGVPDLGAMVFNGGFLWAIGGAAGTNIIQKINVTAMTASDITVTADTGATVTALATNGTYVYAFVEGGTFDPNSVIQIDVAGTAVSVVSTNLVTVGAVQMVISLAGDLYVLMPGMNQVRKYDVTTGNLLTTHTFIDPINIVQAGAEIFVLEGSTKKLHSISALDVVTATVTFAFTPSDIEYDGTELWVSSGDTLRKVLVNGTILHSIVPESGLTIRKVIKGNGSIWVVFSDDADLGTNIVKIYPGLPGI